MGGFSCSEECDVNCTFFFYLCNPGSVAQIKKKL